MIYLLTNHKADYDELQNVVVRADCELDARLFVFSTTFDTWQIEHFPGKDTYERFYRGLEKSAIIWLEQATCKLLEPEGEPEIFLTEATEG